jgi:multisubunit Na+/H+ antiporter MnhC subunit
MTKYDPTYQPKSRRTIIPPVHPIWRGIGCIMLILLPIVSFAGAKLLVQANSRQHWVQMPSELSASFTLPMIGRVLYADLALTAILVVIGFAIITVVYSVIYRIIGISRYGPLDSPPG